MVPGKCANLRSCFSVAEAPKERPQLGQALAARCRTLPVGQRNCLPSAWDAIGAIAVGFLILSVQNPDVVAACGLTAAGQVHCLDLLESMGLLIAQAKQTERSWKWCCRSLSAVAQAGLWWAAYEAGCVMVQATATTFLAGHPNGATTSPGNHFFRLMVCL